MIAYRKRSFDSAHELLDQLRTNPSNSALLLPLQYLLIEEILHAETKIRTAKGRLRGNTDARQQSRLRRQIEGWRRLAFVWRCFGDAIAFLYLDKFALKQTYYNTENENPKNSPGFLGGKGGLEAELKLLAEAIEHGIPGLASQLRTALAAHVPLKLVNGR